MALSLAVSMLLVAPGEARAHDSCAIAAPVVQPAARPAVLGFFGRLLAFAKVFTPSSDTTAETDAGCTDKFAEVEVKLDRDWVSPAVADPYATAAEKKADKGKKAPKTFAPCEDGLAADFFPCENIDLLSHVSMTELGVQRVNDIWGWTDARTKDDYALLGSTTGTVFVRITDPKRPVVLGILPTASTTGGSSWRDIKVYEDHAYIVSEHTNHGVQVFDLTRLRDWSGSYTTYGVDAHYTGHGNAHNIHINTDTGFAYTVGAGTFSSQPQPNTVTVDAPSSAAGNYLASNANFGPRPTVAGLAGPFAIGSSSDGTTLGCSELVGFPAGAIAIVDRGACAFTVKVKNAQNAGASAVVVANNTTGVITMGGADDTITIPSVMVSQADGATIKSGLPATGSMKANDPPSVCGTGLHMIDVRTPKSPTYAGCMDDTGYVHDTQCVVYAGPDTEFTGREICFNSNGINFSTNGNNFVSIVDVTNKAAPVVLSRLPYEGSGYSHQGWLTEDQAYFLHGDEGDEQLRNVNTTTRVWDVTDLRNPSVVNVFVNDTTSIDHNLYVEDRFAYASNYTTGLRVLDVTDPSGGPVEVGFFDVYPDNDNATFEGGTWSNYPYFRQKKVVAVSSIDRGLFILRSHVEPAGS